MQPGRPRAEAQGPSHRGQHPGAEAGPRGRAGASPPRRTGPGGPARAAAARSGLVRPLSLLRSLPAFLRPLHPSSPPGCPSVPPAPPRPPGLCCPGPATPASEPDQGHCPPTWLRPFTKAGGSLLTPNTPPHPGLSPAPRTSSQAHPRASSPWPGTGW